ncbi:hypothetical protein [Mesorhizobium japonicum]|uniref:Mlr9732 protein n=1 Tax=Mesorhizobium japonicum (strain LMG 29417 / CECT 9101 / MAFF 303099) TaxID=266835 RepID=Q98NU9_RHILO|nr:hypothetical protein [Mesorhizobium japonicum]BAB54906.1 mlr9732 [Mesorhizobium japonicum MAFF 303099]
MSEDKAASQSPSIGDNQPSTDPALLLSLAWIDAHVAMLASCVRQQQAEEGPLERCALLPPGEVMGGGEGIGAYRDYLDARTVERDDAEKADALLAEIATTPARSMAGVIAKLAVILREASDNTDLCEFPLPHIRSALADLRRLTHETVSDPPASWPAGDQSIGILFEQPASSFAAWRAFRAWSQGDDDAYRAWTDTFKTLQGVSQ